MNSYSIVIPAYNEEGVISEVLGQILALKDIALEVIVVNDHSSDKTALEAKKHPVVVISNVQNFGYGYSLKAGILAAQNEHIIILDADGSYPVAAIPELIGVYEQGFDMVVGARQGNHYRGTQVKRIARVWFRALSEFATGRRIPDINSGFRIFRRTTALKFFRTLSNGFSFTTTITLAFMLNSYSVKYVATEYHKRVGNSKVKYGRDTIRALQIIIESITFYNPLKIFLICVMGVLASGLISGIIAYWNVTASILFLITVSFAILTLSVGFLGVFLKFMHAGPDKFEISS